MITTVLLENGDDGEKRGCTFCVFLLNGDPETDRGGSLRFDFRSKGVPGEKRGDTANLVSLKGERESDRGSFLLL